MKLSGKARGTVRCRGPAFAAAFGLCFLALFLSAHARGAETHVLACSFDERLTDESGVAPLDSKDVRFVPGREGQAVLIERPGVLTYPAAALNPTAFTISFRVRHEKPLREYFFQRLVYFYHETPDLKNRIGIQKRAGTNTLVFFMSDAQGQAKGKEFGGDWFAMATSPMQWPARSWHYIVCTADKSRQLAQFFVDGSKVGEARGTQFPEQMGEKIWIGTELGHSWMRGALDELRIEPVAHLDDKPAPATPAGAAALPLAPRVLGQSVSGLTGKELTINLDFFDICIGTDTWDLRYGDAEMDRLMAMCAHYGVDRMFFRLSVCGAVCYHTKVMAPAYEDAFRQYEGRDLLDSGCANIPSVIPRMAAVMRQIDPLESGARHARKHGMRIYAWVTSFDSMYYATANEFFLKHPEYTWVSRDGSKHIPGVPCYAYPEVREYRLNQVKELLEYDIDGIVFSPRSHSPWPPQRASREYGFNQPVVDEYKRRYGKDPREAAPDSLDELRYVQLKADFYTQFLCDVKRLTESAGRRLVMVISASIADPVRAGRMYIDADRLARERIVDELCLMGSASADLNHWRLLADGKIRMTTWAGVHAKYYEQCRDNMRKHFGAMLGNPTSDGSTFHELANLIYPDCWEEALLDTLRERR